MKLKSFFVALAIALFSICSTKATAQIDFSNMNYQAEVDFAYSVGVGNWQSSRINFQTIHGVQFDDYLFAGVGTGIDYFHDAEAAFMPLFLNAKGFLPISGSIVTPFVSLDLGYGICLSENGESGFTITPAIGVKLFDKFKFQMGYNSQKMSNNGVSLNYGAIQFKIGYFF